MIRPWDCHPDLHVYSLMCGAFSSRHGPTAFVMKGFPDVLPCVRVEDGVVITFFRIHVLEAHVINVHECVDDVYR